MRKAGRILFILALVGILAGCTTQKRRGEYSPLGKVYHNTTARYNGYYNADVILTESFVNLSNQHEENYNQVLPVYPYIYIDNPQAAAGELDRAIEKVTIVATLHPGSNWTDDCYLLIAKCQFLKKDYESAEETLEYMTLQYSPEAVAKREKEQMKKSNKKSKKVKKKKKNKKKKRRKKKSSKPRKEKKEKPKKEEPEPSIGESEYTQVNDYFMKHRPAYQEGMLWLARTYIQRDRFREAETILIELKNNRNTFKDIRRELAAVEAHFYLVQKRYDSAVAPLERAVKLANKRVNKARYNYILGQLYQRENENLKAYAVFDKAKKYSSDYEMEFNALLNMEQTSWARGGATPEQALGRLKRMLKDEKNTDYAGQIYYSMAKVALQAGLKAEAISYLEESIASGSAGKSQQTESFYLLATLYFEEEDFVNAKYYYDQTLSVMPNTDDRYDEVERLSKNLDEIAKNIEIITMQDSLLRISLMSEKEKKDLANQILKRKKKEAQEATAAQDAKNNAAAGTNLPPGFGRLPGRGSSATTFFAYNTESVRKGKRDFERKWGSRTLEDNWRRSNRPDEDSDFEQPEEEVEANELVLGESNVDEIFKDVPSTTEEIENANQLLREALYQLGTLYRDKLEYNEKCIETLEKLLDRYPNTDRRLEAMYYLYVAHNTLGHAAAAQSYLNKICSEFPESTYCKILKDPSYAATIETREKQLNDYYELTFKRYKEGAYEEAYQRTQDAFERFGADNPLKSKFALLGAFSAGHVNGQEAYVAALKDVVAKYPNTQEEARAKEILRFFGDSDGKEEDEGPFKMDEDDKLHFCIIVIGDKKAKLNDLKVEVSDFNTQYFKLDRLRITNIYLGADTSTPILVIRRFEDKDKAMTYYQAIEKNKQDFISSTDNYQLFMINQHNYRQIIKQRSLEGYEDFFKKNYLDNVN